MSKRDPFVFSFKSPYNLGDTLVSFADLLCDVYARWKGQECVLALKPDQEPPLTSALYMRCPEAPNTAGDDEMVLVAGNRAQTDWAAHVTFKQQGERTYGEVNLDRTKADMLYGPGYARLDEFLILRDRLPMQLAQKASYQIVKVDRK